MATQPHDFITISLVPRSGDGLAVDLVREAAKQHLQGDDEEQAAQLCWLLSIAESSEAVIVELCRNQELHPLLGHQAEPRRLLEEMANVYRYPEAVLTLGVSLYEETHESGDALEGFLEKHGDNVWLLETLARRQASSFAKQSLFLIAAARNPASERIKRIHEQHGLAREAEITEDPEHLRALFASREPKVWLGLARNRRTPESLLEELIEVKDVALAREIREAAKHNLTHR